jgi:hypothetical protein
VFKIPKFGKRIPVNSIIGIQEMLRVVKLPKKKNNKSRYLERDYKTASMLQIP